VDDNYLKVTAVGGRGAGNRLAVINLAQWAGDYTTAGIGKISMDVKNLSDADLSLRLLIADSMAGPPEDSVFSKVPLLLPAGGDWTSPVFPIAPSDLVASAGSVATALANATELRIYHSAASGFPGEPIVAQLGMDNIRADGVPEAGSTALRLGLSAGALMAGRRRGRRVTSGSGPARG
jgi:hypothetical protein